VKIISVELVRCQLRDEPNAVREWRKQLRAGGEHGAEAIFQFKMDAFEHAPEPQQVHEQGAYYELAHRFPLTDTR
jgi:hypothetical protein